MLHAPLANASVNADTALSEWEEGILGSKGASEEGMVLIESPLQDSVSSSVVDGVPSVGATSMASTLLSDESVRFFRDSLNWTSSSAEAESRIMTSSESSVGSNDIRAIIERERVSPL